MSERQYFDTFDPFDHNRLYGDEKYRLQNMVLCSHNMPSCYVPGVDKPYSVYSDRIHGLWYDIMGGKCGFRVESSMNGDAFLAGLDKETALKIATAICEVYAPEIKPTGVAFIRQTNRSSGYPVIVMIAVEQNTKGLPKGITRKPQFYSRMDKRGIEYYGYR